MCDVCVVYTHVDIGSHAVHRREKDVGCPALMLTALAPDTLSLTKVGVRVATSKSHNPVSTHNNAGGSYMCVAM